MVAITDFLLAFHPSRSCRGAASTNKRNQEGPIFPSMSFSNLPRAHIDPIGAPLVALRLILMMVDPEVSAETLVLTLDHRRCGVSITHVSGTDDPDTCSASSTHSQSRHGRRSVSPVLSLPRFDRTSTSRSATWPDGTKPTDHAGSPTLSSSSGLWSVHRSRARVSSAEFRRDGGADQSCVVGAGSALRARRCAGDSRSPALRNRRRSSRLSTAVAPVLITWARYDSGMS